MKKDYIIMIALFITFPVYSAMKVANSNQSQNKINFSRGNLPLHKYPTRKNCKEREKLVSVIQSKNASALKKSIAHFNLGNRFVHEEKYQSAEEQFKKSINTQPSFAAYFNLGMLKMKLQKYEEAKNNLLKALFMAQSSKNNMHLELVCNNLKKLIEKN